MTEGDRGVERAGELASAEFDSAGGGSHQHGGDKGILPGQLMLYREFVRSVFIGGNRG